MTRMMERRATLVICVAGLVLAGGASLSLRAASLNVDLMARWTVATIVQYTVIAEFSGEAVLFPLNGGLAGRGTVTDRFEVEFDWNPSEFSMTGKPVIRNFPSKLGAVSKNGTCTVAVSGPFEHATIVELRNDPVLGMANAVHAEVRRDLPSGTFATNNEVGPCANVLSAAARTVRQRIAVPAPQGMMLAMPTGQAGYQHNGKSFVIKGTSTEDRGWTFTVTPTIVK